MHYFNTLEFAKEQDALDVLSSFRNKFHIPKDKKGAPPFSIDDNLFVMP